MRTEVPHGATLTSQCDCRIELVLCMAHRIEQKLASTMPYLYKALEWITPVGPPGNSSSPDVTRVGDGIDPIRDEPGDL